MTTTDREEPGIFAEFREANEPVIVAVRPPVGTEQVHPSLLPLVEFLSAPRVESHVAAWLAEHDLPTDTADRLVRSRYAIWVTASDGMTAAAALSGVRVVADSELASETTIYGQRGIRALDDRTRTYVVTPELAAALFDGRTDLDIPRSIREYTAAGYRRECLVANGFIAELPMLLRWRFAHLEWVEPAPAPTVFGPHTGFGDVFFNGGIQPCFVLLGEIDRADGPGNYKLVGNRKLPQPIPAELADVYEFLSVPRWGYEVAEYFRWANLTHALLTRLLFSGIITTVKTGSGWAAVKSLRGLRIAPLSTIETHPQFNFVSVFDRDEYEVAFTVRQPAADLIWGSHHGDLLTAIKDTAKRTGTNRADLANQVMSYLPELLKLSAIRLEWVRLR